MPTYDYLCSKCNHGFESFAKMSDVPATRKCPSCGARARRQISGGAGFLFKGEGFYITDYRSADYKSKASADKEPVATDASSSKSKSKSKPSEASDAKPASGPEKQGGKS